MKILFSSYAYAPSVGGIETTSALLAREFIAAGHEIVLITETPGTQTANDSFPIVRKPTLSELRKQLRWCDIVFQNNITLRHFIPTFVARRPVLLVHQTWMRNTAGQIGWNDRLKRALVPRVKNIAVSEAIAQDIGAPAEIIGNPYDDNVFGLRPGIARDRDIIFVGRLVSDKGAEILLHALSLLKEPRTNLTMVGQGPEEKALRTLAGELKLDVTFAGSMSGRKLAELLNHHQIIAIPSRWPEPFGVVALEGIACGCIPVGSEQGGLREAIGPCGVTFANGHAQQLADRLQDLLTDSLLRGKLRAAAPAHLEHFRASAVAQRYLELLSKLVA
jgi:glycogen(starch) synthase